MPAAVPSAPPQAKSASTLEYVNVAEASRQSGLRPYAVRQAALRGEIRVLLVPGRPPTVALEDALAFARQRTPLRRAREA
jgi:hypothetical protein